MESMHFSGVLAFGCFCIMTSFPGSVQTIDDATWGITCPGDAPGGVTCDFGGDRCTQDYRNINQNGWEWSRRHGEIVEGAYRTILNSPPGRIPFMHLAPSDDPNAYGEWVDLVSPAFQVNGGGCLSFHYANRFCDDDNPSATHFHVLLKTPEGMEAFRREYRCAESANWLTERIPLAALSGNFHLVFSGMVSSSLFDTIAISRVVFLDEFCSITSDSNFRPGDVDFEDSDMSGYIQQNSLTDHRFWRLIRRENLNNGNGPSQDAYYGNFMVLTVGSPVDEATRLVSPALNVDRPGCATILYHNGCTDSSQANQLTIGRTQSISDPFDQMELFQTLPLTYSTKWLTAYVDLPEGVYHLTVTAEVKRSWDYRQCYIAVDDIEVFDQPCDVIRWCMPTACPQGFHPASEEPCSPGGYCVNYQGRKRVQCRCHDRRYGKDCSYVLS